MEDTFENKLVNSRKLLKKYALKFTSNIDDVEDLVQNAQLKAFKNKDKYRNDENFIGWLYTILKFEFINLYRKNKRLRGNGTYDILKINEFFNVENYNEGEKNLRENDILDILKNCNDTRTKTFLLHLEGFQYNEISEMQNIPIGTVKSRVFTCKNEMIEKLNKIDKSYKYEI